MEKQNESEIIVLNLFGYKSIPEDPDEQFSLYEKIEKLLLDKGIIDEEVSLLGETCENLLDILCD